MRGLALEGKLGVRRLLRHPSRTLRFLLYLAKPELNVREKLFVLGQSFDKSRYPVLLEIFFDKSHKAAFNMKATLPLHFYQRDTLEIVIAEVIDDGFFRVEQFSVDDRGIDNFDHRRFAYAFFSIRAYHLWIF